MDLGKGDADDYARWRSIYLLGRFRRNFQVEVDQVIDHMLAQAGEEFPGTIDRPPLRSVEIDHRLRDMGAILVPGDQRVKGDRQGFPAQREVSADPMVRQAIRNTIDRFRGGHGEGGHRMIRRAEKIIAAQMIDQHGIHLRIREVRAGERVHRDAEFPRHQPPVPDLHMAVLQFQRPGVEIEKVPPRPVDDARLRIHVLPAVIMRNRLPFPFRLSAVRFPFFEPARHDGNSPVSGRPQPLHRGFRFPRPVRVTADGEGCFRARE